MPLYPPLPYTGAAFIALWMVACCCCHCVSLPAGEAATCRRSRRRPPQRRQQWEARDAATSSSCSGVVWSAAVTLSAASLVAQAGAQLLYALGVIRDESASQALPSWIELLGLTRRYGLLQMLLVSIGGLGVTSGNSWASHNDTASSGWLLPHLRQHTLFSPCLHGQPLPRPTDLPHPPFTTCPSPPLCTQALVPPLIATLASLGELRRLRQRTPPPLGSSADGVGPDGSTPGPPLASATAEGPLWSAAPHSSPPPLYGPPPAAATGTSHAAYHGDAYYRGNDGSDVSHGDGGGEDLSQPLLASGLYSSTPHRRPPYASASTYGNCNGVAALVLLAALLWPCGAGLPYAILVAATLGMWAYGGGGRGNAATAGRGGSGASSGGGSGGSHLVLRLVLLQLYCCTHLMLQYMYQVGSHISPLPCRFLLMH